MNVKLTKTNSSYSTLAISTGLYSERARNFLDHILVHSIVPGYGGYKNVTRDHATGEVLIEINVNATKEDEFEMKEVANLWIAECTHQIENFIKYSWIQSRQTIKADFKLLLFKLFKIDLGVEFLYNVYHEDVCWLFNCTNSLEMLDSIYKISIESKVKGALRYEPIKISTLKWLLDYFKNGLQSDIPNEIIGTRLTQFEIEATSLLRKEAFDLAAVLYGMNSSLYKKNLIKIEQSFRGTMPITDRMLDAYQRIADRF